MQSVLKKIKDVPKMLADLELQPGNFAAHQFQNLIDSLSNLLLLKQALTMVQQVS